MFQDDGKDEVFFIVEMARQKPGKIGQIAAKPGHRLVLGGVLVQRQNGIRAGGEAVDQAVQGVMIGIEHGKAARDAGFKCREPGEIGVILDLVVADQIVQQARAKPDEAPRIGLRIKVAVDQRCGISREMPQHTAKAKVAIEPEGGKAIEIGVGGPIRARVIGQDQGIFGGQAGAGGKAVITHAATLAGAGPRCKHWTGGGGFA